jgi:hypothetical protein
MIGSCWQTIWPESAKLPPFAEQFPQLPPRRIQIGAVSCTFHGTYFLNTDSHNMKEQHACICTVYSVHTVAVPSSLNIDPTFIGKEGPLRWLQ